jgi:hypothetical protein
MRVSSNGHSCLFWERQAAKPAQRSGWKPELRSTSDINKESRNAGIEERDFRCRTRVEAFVPNGYLLIRCLAQAPLQLSAFRNGGETALKRFFPDEKI